jgi:prefoldin subunit 5
VEKLTELRTPEKQEKYDNALLWMQDYTNDLDKSTLELKQNIKKLMDEMDRLYPETKLKDNDENI